MRLIFADILRRARVRLAIFGVVTAGMWWLTSELGDPLRAFCLTMGYSVMVGPWPALRAIPRPLFYLPVAKRDIWRAGWLFSTVGMTLVTTAAKIAGLIALRATPPLEDLRPVMIGPAGIALSGLYDFATLGLACGLIIVATRPPSTEAPWRQVSIVLMNVADALLPLAALGGFYGASLLHGIVPTAWGQFTPRAAMVLAAVLALAIATYFYSPVPPRVNPAVPRPAAAGPARRVGAGGLSGLPRLFVHEFVWTLLVGAVLGVSSTLVTLVAAGIRSPTELAAFLAGQLHAFDGGPAASPEGGADPFMVMVLFATFAATIAARYPAMMRHLRVMPLGTARLQALLVAWPAAIWLSAWAVLITLHLVFVGGMVRSLHVPAFVGLAGISALVVALSLRTNGPQQGIAFSTLLVTVPMLLFVGFPPAWASLAIGLAGFTAATAMNRAALRRTLTYRHSGSPLALPLTR